MRFALLVAVACGSGCGKRAPARAAEITGSLTVGGEAMSPLACRPGRAVHTFVEIVSPRGILRFEDRELSWSRDVNAQGAGEKLACTRLDRSWGGGSRADGTSYWRGTLSFECTLGPTPVVGDLVLDCGNITPEERQQLDGQRDELREEQRKPK
ncbi:MAG: hypothetical protein H0T42_26215 [Deltaproteobacteria bacterium]|nr:hypothetical protein [Deltaproteobacteria bacterium]